MHIITRTESSQSHMIGVRVKIMGLIITRTHWDFPTFLNFPDPIISSRTRTQAALALGAGCRLTVLGAVDHAAGEDADDAVALLRVAAPEDDLPPPAPCPPSILLDKNRRDIGKDPSKRPVHTMEKTARSRRPRRRAPSRLRGGGHQQRVTGGRGPPGSSPAACVHDRHRAGTHASSSI